MTQGPNSIKQKREDEERLLQAYEIYNKLADGKAQDFKKVKDYLAQTLERLLAEGKIGQGVVLASRVKSPASVVQNWQIGKELNDIFGITLLTNTQKEMDEIRAVLREESKFDISSKKEKNEKRGYEAIHFLFHVGEQKHKTMVECHMQTHEAYKNVYPHILYKVRRTMNRDLSVQEENQIKEKIQQMYQTDELPGFHLSGGRRSRIPQMWVSSFNQQGKMEEYQLDEKMILTIMYPFLNISKSAKVTPRGESEELEQE